MRRLIEQLRAEQPPELDWSSVERGLAERIGENGVVRPHAQAWWHRQSLRKVAAFAVASAALVALVTASGSSGRAPGGPLPERRVVDGAQLPTVQGADGSRLYRVDRIDPGAVVTSGEQPMDFVLPGVARWRLEPHGRVRLRTVGLPHVVELESGALLAEVVPRPRGQTLEESFAVVADRTRIAARGTAFSVHRHDRHVTVDVSEGTVVVGPAGRRGPTPGRLLVARARAAFSLDGGRRARLLPPSLAPGLPAVSHGLMSEPEAAARSAAATQPGHDPAAGLRAEPIGAAGAPLPAAASHAGESPRPGRVHGAAEPGHSGERAFAPLRAGQAHRELVSCLSARSTARAASSDVRVTISSTVHLELDAYRHIVGVRFSPPLKPKLEQCASVLLGRQLLGTDAQFDVTVDR